MQRREFERLEGQEWIVVDEFATMRRKREERGLPEEEQYR